jgi:hypothetical protein
MKKINKSKAQRRLSRLWFSFTLVFIVFLAATAIPTNPTYEIGPLFEWFSPLFFPTFMLILSLFIYDVNQSAFKGISINVFTFQMAFGISLVYLLVVLMLVLGVSVNTELTTVSKLDKLRSFSIFLGPCQGAVTAVLGIFFVKNDT